MISPSQGQSPNPPIKLKGSVFSHNQLGREDLDQKSVLQHQGYEILKLLLGPFSSSVLPRKFQVIYKFHGFCRYCLLFRMSASYIESNVSGPTNQRAFPDEHIMCFIYVVCNIIHIKNPFWKERVYGRKILYNS